MFWTWFRAPLFKLKCLKWLSFFTKSKEIYCFNLGWAQSRGRCSFHAVRLVRNSGKICMKHFVLLKLPLGLPRLSMMDLPFEFEVWKHAVLLIKISSSMISRPCSLIQLMTHFKYNSLTIKLGTQTRSVSNLIFNKHLIGFNGE